jgi:hypothetical protein
VGPTPRRFSREPATPPDLEESAAHGILPGPLEDAAAAFRPGKKHGIRIAGVIPDAGVGSLIPLLRAGSWGVQLIETDGLRNIDGFLFFTDAK